MPTALHLLGSLVLAACISRPAEASDPLHCAEFAALSLEARATYMRGILDGYKMPLAEMRRWTETWSPGVISQEQLDFLRNAVTEQELSLRRVSGRDAADLATLITKECVIRGNSSKPATEAFDDVLLGLLSGRLK